MLLQVLLLGPLIGRTEGKKIRLLAVRLGAQHLAPLVELCQAGKIAAPVAVLTVRGRGPAIR
jgi:hypothetical protein